MNILQIFRHSAECRNICKRKYELMKFAIGIDEVGRGPLAGPVMVAAVLLSQKLKVKSQKWGIRDSKKLSARQREEWVRRIRELNIPYAIARVSPAVIDRINISRAANLAAYRAYTHLCRKLQLPSSKFQITLDGGLYLKHKSWAGKNNIRAATVIRGDENIPAIALASIIAKVARDHYMTRLAILYPGYGFGVHAGYGTRQHLSALRKLGPSPVHRSSFLIKFDRDS